MARHPRLQKRGSRYFLRVKVPNDLRSANYGYGHPGPAYSSSPYAYPGYSYYPNPAYNYYPHHWHGDGDERHGWDRGWGERG